MYESKIRKSYLSIGNRIHKTENNFDCFPLCHCYGYFFVLLDCNHHLIKKPSKREGSEKSTHYAQTFFSVHANSPWLPYQEGGEQKYYKKVGESMSSRNTSYNSSLKGVRLVDSKDAWIITNTGKKMLNPKYQFVGKMRMDMPNMIVSASDKKKPTYK